MKVSNGFFFQIKSPRLLGLVVFNILVLISILIPWTFGSRYRIYFLKSDPHFDLACNGPIGLFQLQFIQINVIHRADNYLFRFQKTIGLTELSFHFCRQQSCLLSLFVTLNYSKFYWISTQMFSIMVLVTLCHSMLCLYRDGK